MPAVIWSLVLYRHLVSLLYLYILSTIYVLSMYIQYIKHICGILSTFHIVALCTWTIFPVAFCPRTLYPVAFCPWTLCPVAFCPWTFYTDKMYWLAFLTGKQILEKYKTQHNWYTHSTVLLLLFLKYKVHWWLLTWLCPIYSLPGDF